MLKLTSEKLELNIFEYKTIYDDVSKLKDIKAIHQYIEFGIAEGRHNSFESLLKKLDIKN